MIGWISFLELYQVIVSDSSTRMYVLNKKNSMQKPPWKKTTRALCFEDQVQLIEKNATLVTPMWNKHSILSVRLPFMQSKHLSGQVTIKVGVTSCRLKRVLICASKPYEKQS